MQNTPEGLLCPGEELGRRDELMVLWGSASPVLSRAKRSARKMGLYFGDESGLLKVRLSRGQRLSFVFKVGAFKGRKESCDVKWERVPNARGCSQTPSSLWRALLSHLDMLSELRVGKAFLFHPLPPIPSSSSSSASSILALLHLSPSV